MVLLFAMENLRFSTTGNSLQITGDVYEHVHRDTVVKVTNKMQLCRLIYYS